MPITWILLVRQRSARIQFIPLLSVCILTLSALVTVGYLHRLQYAALATLVRSIISPVIHADYLHLCVNMLGGLVVLSLVEETCGWRQTLFVVLLSYCLHVVSIAFIRIVFDNPMDIIGLSSIIYTGIGFYSKEKYPNLSIKEKTFFWQFLVLMVILDVSIRSIFVHLVAMAVGLILSIFKQKMRRLGLHQFLPGHSNSN